MVAMAPSGLLYYRYNRRYYCTYTCWDASYSQLGAKIVDEIPVRHDEYCAWLASKRAEYAAIEACLEREVYELQDDTVNLRQMYRDFEELPSEFPRPLDGYDVYSYLINLDQEILTMNHSVHWKLSNIAWQKHHWYRYITDSKYYDRPTIDLRICPEFYVASPALKLPDLDQQVHYDSEIVNTAGNIQTAHEVFLTNALARVLITCQPQITRFAMEWSPDSFPFRELCFALISIASGTARLYAFPSPWNYPPYNIDRDWAYAAEKKVPQIPFGSMFHRPGSPPGASPGESTYWHAGVLVSLVQVIDGKAISTAVAHGVGQGRSHFQMVVLSLFKVLFAEVSRGLNGEPFVTMTDKIQLSPLRMNYCTSSHPRMRPAAEEGQVPRRRRGESVMAGNCTGTVQKLREHFPGLAALVKFFTVAGNRRVATKSWGILPPELYEQILDHVDYKTWRNCLEVSQEMRYNCLRKYRLDEQMRIVAGPFSESRNWQRGPRLSFEVEIMRSGRIFRIIEPPCQLLHRQSYSWMPIIGGNLETVMDAVTLNFIARDEEEEQEDESKLY